jgi:hypothetical protein
MEDKLGLKDIQSERKMQIARKTRKKGKSPETLRNERVDYGKVAGKAIVEQYDACDMNLPEAIEKADIKSKKITPGLVDLWRKNIPEFNEAMRNVELTKFYELKSQMFQNAKKDSRNAKIYFDIFGLPAESHESNANHSPKGTVGFTAQDYEAMN